MFFLSLLRVRWFGWKIRGKCGFHRVCVLQTICSCYFLQIVLGGNVKSNLIELSKFGITVSDVWRNAILQYLTCDFISISEALMCRWLAPHSPTNAW